MGRVVGLGLAQDRGQVSLGPRQGERQAAGKDPAARQEFLDSSATQLDRLDWLAQNLLELSKLDSGLVLLDLRPDDIRGTVEKSLARAAKDKVRESDVIQNMLHDDLAALVYDRLKRRPMVLPVVVEV